jgi:hypothetical protein
MSLDIFIESNYKIACDIQRGINKDNKMKEMLIRGIIDKRLVISWMREYGLFQGINTSDRNNIVEKYASIAFEVANPTHRPDTKAIETMFKRFLSEFYHTVNRKWLSATSKLLWCSYPDEIVIYDAFVERALVVLQCITPYLAKMPRIKTSPRIKSLDDIDRVVTFYMNYQNMIKAIIFEHKEKLLRLRSIYNEVYPHDIRIIDKLLWILGNPKQSFKLKV